MCLDSRGDFTLIYNVMLISVNIFFAIHGFVM